jgi:hypothetical protein
LAFFADFKNRQKAAEGARTMIGVDGYTVMPPKAKAGCEWSCTGKRKVVKLPSRSVLH